MALSCVCALPLTYQILHPFVTSADNSTAFYAQPARNFLRHGLIATRMGLVIDTGDEVEEFSYYARRPPLAALGASAAFLLLGVSDWSARIYPAACSLASAILLFFIWRRVRGDLAAALVVLVMASLPAYGHFGKMLGDEAPTLMFALGAILLYLKWKEAPPRQAPRFLTGCLASYALGCMSGWAAFLAGPVLMADSALTLADRKRERRHAVLGIGLTGLFTFALLVIHLAFLAGSLNEILGVAAARTLRSAYSHEIDPGLLPWFHRGVGHFQRLFGMEAALLGTLGLCSGLIALARKRAPEGALETFGILALFGIANPLLLRWHLYDHDWLLFHLIPAVAIAAGEGILLLVNSVGNLVRRARGPRSLSRIAVLLVLSLALGHRAFVGARGLEALAGEAPQFAWPLLGREVARLAPEGSHLMANFRFHGWPLRFYADRPSWTVLSLERFEDLLRRRDYALYLRDVNVAIDLELEMRLRQYARVDAGTCLVYRLNTPRIEPVPAEGASEGTAATVPATGALSADFSGVVRLTGYEVQLPEELPRPLSPAASFLGLPGSSISPARVVKVTSYWSASGADLPEWSLVARMTRRTDDGDWLSLPPVQLPQTRPVLSWWRGRERFSIESAFLALDGFPGADYEIRFALYDGRLAVPPTLAGGSTPWEIRNVVAGPISLKPPPGGGDADPDRE